MMNNFIGKDGFYWWMGVVEKRNDPLNLGRVRVRIFGWHTENKQLIPTDELPWAQPMLPINASLTNATPQEGDFAFGFFMDGQSGQAPCIMGIFPGIPRDFPKEGEGFADARTDAELQNSPRKVKYEGSSINDDDPKKNPININEPSTSRLYRNEKIDKTFVQFKKDNRDLLVSTAVGGVWNEPETKYNAVPPYNHVTETESGHIMEFDDTPSAERIQIAHRKGSFVEFFPDGSKVTKVMGKDYEIVLEDQNIHIKGNYNLTVDGGANILVKGNANVLTPKNINATAGMSINATAGGSVTAIAGLDASVTAGGTVSVTAGGAVSVTGGGNVSVKAPTASVTAATTTVNGNLKVNGIIQGSMIRTDAGVILDSHQHIGVKGGPDISGPPLV